jgi:ribosomal protein L40E
LLPLCSESFAFLYSLQKLEDIYVYTRAVLKVCGLAAVRRCYAEGSMTAVHCRQSTNFSSDPRSCSAILKNGSFKTTVTQTLTTVEG